MKRQGYIFQEIVKLENIKFAIIKASENKRNRRSVKRILSDIDFYALKLQNLLLNNQFTPTNPVQKEVIKKNGKKRTVYMVPFYPDLCVQWAVINAMEESVFMKGMYYHSYGSIPERGPHKAKKAVEKWVRKDKRYTKYCLSVDIDNFYPTVNCGILKNMLRKHIKDYNALSLIERIIDVHDIGTPMGLYSSPWLANFYLQEFDHFVKEQLHIKYYARYTDNMLFFGNNKKKLHKAFDEIVKYLKNIGLTLNDDWQVFKVDSRPVDFVGYVIDREQTRVRKSTALRMTRRIRKISKKKKLTYKDASAVMSYGGITKHCNARMLYRTGIQPYINIKQIKEVIRNESKKKNREFFKTAVIQYQRI